MKSNKEKLDEIEIISKQRIHKYRPMNPHPMSFFIGFSDGAEWQSERMYSEEEVFNLLNFVNDRLPDLYSRFSPEEELEYWFKERKK